MFHHNYQGGFSLLEVIVALSLLIMTSSVVIPILTKVYQERLTIQEEQLALEQIKIKLHEWLYNDLLSSETELENHHNTVFHFTNILRENELTVCIKWEGRNHRFYERCESAKK
ncbi:type II secretion system protein [Bacillus sp. FJAT-45350]|uniref:type II secretion system protein n=1 Tax=Bacillus sp. FJAT-45350 TaxID=2011014 RepID=UPI000BB6B6D0|nr:type II secretion system protein [Bacillus sp. FJAT-45350]